VAEVDPGAARDQARQVLEGDRYRSRDVPRPLEGVLRWIGERVQDVLEPIGDLLSTPGGLALGVIVVVGATTALVVALVRRRTRVAEQAEDRRARARRPDPAALEAEADRAEADGDLDVAVRLRFRAGVARLEQAGVVPARADATTARLVDRVGVPAFGPLARSFDEVAYGGRSATTEDVAAARRDWPVVVGTARPEAET
jgi:hypothetical protein